MRKLANLRVTSGKKLLLAAMCLITVVAVSKAELYVIPYLPAGGGWNSRLLLSNPGAAPVQAEIKFFQADGQPAGNDSALRLDVGGRAVRDLEVAPSTTDPNAPIAWATLETTGPLQILSFSDVSPKERLAPAESGIEERALKLIGSPDCSVPNNGNGKGCMPATPGTVARSKALTRVTAVTALPSGRGFQMPIAVRRSAGNDARLILANPGGTTATVQITLVHGDGYDRATRVVQVPPRARVSGMVTDPELFALELGSLEAFSGTVTICSDIPIGLLGLGMGPDTTFSLPVSPRVECPGGGQSR